MTSYNAINGVPASTSSLFLETVARQRWGFDQYHSFVTSDCDAVSSPLSSVTMSPDELFRLQTSMILTIMIRAMHLQLDNLSTLEPIWTVVQHIRHTFQMPSLKTLPKRTRYGRRQSDSMQRSYDSAISIQRPASHSALLAGKLSTPLMLVILPTVLL